MNLSFRDINYELALALKHLRASIKYVRRRDKTDDAVVAGEYRTYA